jgi:hypothetical protein
MITIFRKIRQKLLQQNRVTRYLVYALGEIILVVIGILIALQVNNWNEAKNNEKRFTKILQEISKDAQRDFIRALNINTSELKVDSLINRALKGQISREEYTKENLNLFYVGLQYYPFEMQKTAFKKLENYPGIIPEKYDSLLTEINYYHIELSGMYYTTYENYREQINQRHEFLARNYEWYAQFRQREVTEEIVDFYLENYLYKNWLTRHLTDNPTGEHSPLEFIQRQSAKLILLINKIPGENNFSEDFKNRIGEPMPESEKEFLGKYFLEKEGIEFSLSEINGYLFLYNYIPMKRVGEGKYDDLLKGFSFTFFKDEEGKLSLTYSVKNEPDEIALKIKD